MGWYSNQNYCCHSKKNDNGDKTMKILGFDVGMDNQPIIYPIKKICQICKKEHFAKNNREYIMCKECLDNPENQCWNM